MSGAGQPVAWWRRRARASSIPRSCKPVALAGPLICVHGKQEPLTPPPPKETEHRPLHAANRWLVSTKTLLVQSPTLQPVTIKEPSVPSEDTTKANTKPGLPAAPPAVAPEPRDGGEAYIAPHAGTAVVSELAVRTSEQGARGGSCRK
jgi:hypothetical protein